MSDQPVFLYEATAEIIRTALESAFEQGTITDDDFTDVIESLNGVPRNVVCPGRTFHRFASHVCDPDADVS